MAGRIGCAGILLALMLRRDGAVTAYLRTKAERDRLTDALYAMIRR